MKRTILLLVLLLTIFPAVAGEFWNELWRNADQRGEALMQQGDAINAAKVYADPRRKAYAKLKTGDYAGAAQDLEKLQDTDSAYNRGNALAHAGNLQGAIDAYDAALKSDPKNEDARHNRELVVNALKQQKSEQKNSAGDQSQKDKQNNQEQSDSSKQDDKDKQSGQGEKKEQAGKSESKNSDQQGDGSKSDAQSAKQQDSTKQDIPGKDGDKSQDSKSQNTKDKGDPSDTAKQSAQSGNQERAKDDAEQARRDAEASLSKEYPDGNKGKAASSEAMTTLPQKSEKQIAQEQWLRSIPEDPGGLLRRKFMIEHMMRQQKAKQ